MQGACCGLLVRTGGPIGGRLDLTKGVVMSATEIDEGKLEAFMGQAVTDMGAIISGPLMLIGEKLGLYKAMAHAGPLTSQEVAERSGAAERYVREWLGNQAAGGYVTYDPESDRYTLPDEHALAPRSIAGITQRLDLQELVSNAHIPRLLAERAAFPAIVDRHEFLGCRNETLLRCIEPDDRIARFTEQPKWCGDIGGAGPETII